MTGSIPYLVTVDTFSGGVRERIVVGVRRVVSVEDCSVFTNLVSS